MVSIKSFVVILFRQGYPAGNVGLPAEESRGIVEAKKVAEIASQGSAEPAEPRTWIHTRDGYIGPSRCGNLIGIIIQRRGAVRPAEVLSSA